ncbi:MAG: DUF3021 domain-containing protein [Clostridia bacterium]|nr:DUF3021 domain-containing protein [Clostridia bacterium]
MNKYLKEFLHRGLMFGGFGPIVMSIIMLILSCTLPQFSLSGTEIFTAVVSTYILAFLQSGASVFNQIEHWSVPKSLLCHFSLIYVAYSVCYIINSWIPFKAQVIAIFTVIFVTVYFIVWGIVYVCVRKVSKKLNEQLKS